MTKLLEIEGLHTHFRTEAGVLKAVNGVHLHVHENEIVGIVGESGCGKSVTMLSVLQLISPPGKIVGGRVLFQGQDLLEYRPKGPEMRSVRGGKIAMIFQEPMTSLNPVLTIGRQIAGVVQLHLGMTGQEARSRAVELLTMVGIPAPEARLKDYPHQLSGGMRQRVMIAMGLSCNPRLLIADEPTTALDVTTQAQLLDLMKSLSGRVESSLVIVTHNLGVVARYAHRIYVMYAGRVVETGICKEIFRDPRHPYTIGLLESVPRPDEELGKKLVPIPGSPPDLLDVRSTCAFLARCPYKIDRCFNEPCLELQPVGGDAAHLVGCPLDTAAAAQRTAERAAKNRRPGPARAGPQAPAQESRSTVLEIADLKVYFPVVRGLRRRKVADVRAVDGLSFSVGKGETLGLVGESGCGKTTVGRCVLGLCRPTAGHIYFEGEDIATYREKQLRQFRAKVALVFQDPYSSLDPRQNAKGIVGDPLRVHHRVKNRQQYEQRVEELMQVVGLDPSMARRFPHEFSGGQRQRLGVARALSCDPRLIVFDEPVSALDVSIQAQIVNLLQDLQEATPWLSYLFIAHDLSVVRHVSDRIAVMYLGRIVEVASAADVCAHPVHPYTQALISAIPIPDPFVEETRQRIILGGEVPSPLDPPPGCSFHTRCRLAAEECRCLAPALRDLGACHQVACHAFGSGGFKE
jgi:peptide/nickel transport system ATP-binding protein